MGTHPIFESDFDCLTERYVLMEDVAPMIGRVLKANHDYEYDTENRDGTQRHIKMTRGEKYILLRVTNDEWWDVIHHDFKIKKEKKFYVPAKYVSKLDQIFTEDQCDHEDFLKRIEKDRKKAEKQKRRSLAPQNHRPIDRPLSTFDDGTILSPDNSISGCNYTPTSGLSTMTRTQIKRSSDPDKSAVIGALAEQ